MVPASNASRLTQNDAKTLRILWFFDPGAGARWGGGMLTRDGAVRDLFFFLAIAVRIRVVPSPAR
jgi:hypothetical protein